MAVTGQYSVAGNALSLESSDKDQGAMVGQVTSGGADQFQFALAGGPPGTPSLTFHRISQQ